MRGLALIAVPLFLTACSQGPLSLMRETTGAVSQVICSKAFISGIEPEDVMRLHLGPEPGMNLISWAIAYEVDRERREASARIAGLFPRRAAYAEGRGCTLLYPDYPRPEPIALQPLAPPLLADIGPAEAVEPDGALKAVLDQAFTEPADGTRRATQAVVVVKGGRIIAERYALGAGPETPLLSHSIVKSITSSLIGILVRENKLRTDDLAPVAAWRKEGDPRAAVTIDMLLRMSGGFGFDEGGGSSSSTQIWYNAPDTAAAAEKMTLVDPPGARWGYSSRSYVLLSRIIGETVGGGPAGVAQFAHKELFGPLGMSSAVLEFDASGTMMGAHVSYATPRDFARLGLLYLNDGVIGGERILPEGWTDYVRRPTGESGYGAGFWLNTRADTIDYWGFPWGLPGVPGDAYMARGYMGQFVVIVPSRDLVIVRMGQTHEPGPDAHGVGALVAGVIASLDGSQSGR